MKVLGTSFPGHNDLCALNHTLLRLFSKARKLHRPLTWDLDWLGWQIPYPTYTAALAIRLWIADDFKLLPVGHLTGVPTSKCQVPLGIEIPLSLTRYHRISFADAKNVEDAFSTALHQQEEAPPRLGHRTM